MQRFLCLVLLLSTLPTIAQETRSMIFGRALDPQSSAIADAQVTVTNTDTNVSIPVVTNATGYYEARLLLPGNYQVSAQAPGFKKSVRRGILLPISTQQEVDVTLELGAVSDTVTVTAEAALLDTSSDSSGRVIDSKTRAGVPVSSANITVFARLVAGVQSNGEVRVLRPGDQGSSSDYRINGNVGGNEWNVDGVSNNGSGGRTVGYLPHADEISEMKVETSGFDASAGHATGVFVSLMTKSGTNIYHGSASNILEQTRWNATPFFTRQLYYKNIAAAAAAGNNALADQLRHSEKQLSGRYNHYNGTFGGPVLIPRVYNGRDKLFFFVSFTGIRRVIPPNPINYNWTFPTMANRSGDFSQLLLVDASRYQIYDPLSARPDPARAGHIIRDPFARNILPASRAVNPAYNAYNKIMPVPNNEPTDPKQEPLNNFLGTDIPWTTTYHAITNRMDYQLSSRHRFYGRWTVDHYTLDPNDWAWRTQPGLMSTPDARDNIPGIFDWVWTASASTVLDFSVGMNQYAGGAINQVSKEFKPSAIGLPAYLDQRAGPDAIFPIMNVSGYSRLECPFQTSRAFEMAMRGWMFRTFAASTRYEVDLKPAGITGLAAAEETPQDRTISTTPSRSEPTMASCRRAAWVIPGRRS